MAEWLLQLLHFLIERAGPVKQPKQRWSWLLGGGWEAGVGG